MCIFGICGQSLTVQLVGVSCANLSVDGLQKQCLKRSENHGGFDGKVSLVG